MGFPSAWAIFVQDWCRLRLRGFALVDDQENEGDGQQAVGHGAMFALGDNKAIMGQRNGDGSIRLYFALRTSEDPSRSQGDATVEVDVVRDQLRDTFSGWDPKLLALLDEVDGGFSYWPLYTMPVTQRWTAHHNLTLVGDAAHVMPPFSGQGVNMALLDAVELIDALFAPEHRTIDDALTSYEQTMLERMRGAIAEANADADRLIASTGPAPLPYLPFTPTGTSAEQIRSGPMNAPNCTTDGDQQ